MRKKSSYIICIEAQSKLRGDIVICKCSGCA